MTPGPKQSSRNSPPTRITNFGIHQGDPIQPDNRLQFAEQQNNQLFNPLMPPPKKNTPYQINLLIRNVEDLCVRTLSPLIKFTLSVVFRDFNQVEDIVLLILIHQREIATEGPSIRKLSVSDGDAFVHPLAAVSFGDGNRGFVRIG